MAIITISRGSYSKGRQVAEETARRLGYELVSREILLEASEVFHIPEVKLVRAIHDAPSILNRFSHGRHCFLAFVRSALANHAAADNIVYHGLAGHLLLKGIPHVIKVRIIADLEERIFAEMERENIGYTEARDVLLQDDAERRRWTHSLYGVDPWDASLYDLVIHINNLNVDDAVDFIVQAAQKECFKTTTEAQRKIDDLALACRVKALLVEENCSDVAVTSEYGNVIIYTKLGDRRVHRLEEKIRPLVNGLEGAKYLEIRTDQPFPPEAC